MLLGGALGLALFPGHVTATVAGMLFGAVAGTAVALAAALLGAGLCLLAARLAGAGRGRRRCSVSAAGAGATSCRTTASAPCSPAGSLPACRPAIVNYLAGLAGIRLRAFAAAVAIGALPKTIAYVALGGALADPLSMRGGDRSRRSTSRPPSPGRSSLAGCWCQKRVTSMA